MKPPTNPRPRLRLVLLAHPFELALGAALAINGIRGLLGSLSPAVAVLPDAPRFLYLVVSAIGGLGVIAGLLINHPPRCAGVGKALEQASLYLVAASYAVLALVIFSGFGIAGTGQALVCLVVGGACLLRAKAIALTSAIILEELTHRNRNAHTAEEGPRHA